MPGAALQALLSLINLLTKGLILFHPWLYGAATPKGFEIGLPVIKIDYIVLVKFFLVPARHQNRIVG